MIDLATARLVLELTNSDYWGVRQEYFAEVKTAVDGYMGIEGGRVTAFQSDMRQAMTEAFPQAFEAGYVDGGGELPLDDDADAWLTSKMNAEMGYIGMTFQNMRQLKMSGDLPATQGAGDDTADRYATTLDGVYNQGKLMGAGNKMLEFGGTDGEESCKTCQKLKGQKHRASWWVSHGLVPGQPGNENFECGGWHCDHYLQDADGNLFTI